MDKYIAHSSPDSSGDHKVHNESKDCPHMPPRDNRKYLGRFLNSYVAVGEARKTDIQAHGCHYCAKTPHLQQSVQRQRVFR